MSVNKYLDTFRSALPNTQGNQILKVLISQKDSGQIKTVDEFKDKLKALTAQLINQRITPTIKLFKAVGGEDLSSEQHNFMLERIQDDLEAGFAEADNLDEIIEAHHNVINNVALKALKYGVNELESKISLYEFLNSSIQGFNDAQFNTFRESQKLTTARSDAAASIVYIDPRVGDIPQTDEDVFEDSVGERITLGFDISDYKKVSNIEWLSNPNSIRSEISIAFDSSNILNVLDNKKNTFWIEPIVLSSVRRVGVPMELALYLSGSQDLNFIEIEPASKQPMLLLGIDYYDANNVRRTALEEQITLDGQKRINFNKINASNLILRFRQDHYKEVQFKEKLGVSNFDLAVRGKNNLPIDLLSVSDDLRATLSSDFLLDDIFGVRTNNNELKKYYEYILGFDNIRTGFSSYQDRGIFVSAKKSVDKAGIIGLKVKETRPVQEAGSGTIAISEHTYDARGIISDDTFFHSSVEYWLVTQSYSSDNFLFATDRIPILPLGAERIYHERLVLTHKHASTAPNKNTGATMHYTDDDQTDVIVYRNATPLVYGTEWRFVVPGDSPPEAVLMTTPGQGKPMRRGIRILGSINILDIYTISYTPKVSNTHLIPSSTALLDIVDLSGDQGLRVSPDNLINIEPLRLSYDVGKVDVYLVIIIRGNSANTYVSAAVEEYLLSVGSRDETRFEVV